MAAGQFDSYVKSNLSKYRHKDKTQKDVLLVFKTFRDLRPKLDTYIFNDGTRRELLCIEGTIPVFYKGNTYNIPVCIWLMDTHPDNPPLCFVKPSPDMLIKPSKYLDANGRIYLPYLHDWKYPSSDLIGLLQVMSAVFGEHSPVFARDSQPGPPRPTDTPEAQPPAYAPLPTRTPAPEPIAKIRKQDVCGASPVNPVPAVKDWSAADVQSWLREITLPELYQTLDFPDGSELEVLYDQYCQNPTKFKDDMKSDYQMSPKISRKFAGALKKLFPS